MACRYQYISTTTAVNGAFDLGVVAGTWSIMLENDSANQANLVGPSLSYTVIDGQTIPAIAYQVRSGTATISGTVKDSANNPVSAANVYAYATINSVQYNAGAQTDGNGTYSFPVINGTWHVGVNANDYPNLTNNASYGGVTSSTLLVTGATSGQNGYRYRAIATNLVSSAVSDQVLLTVTTLFDQWRQSKFTAGPLANPAISGALATPAGDGVTNLFKYAFNLQPFTGATYSQALPPPTVIGGNLVFTFQAIRPDVTYTMETGTDLVHWSTNGITMQANGTTRSASYSLADHPKAFFRLAVTQQ